MHVTTQRIRILLVAMLHRHVPLVVATTLYFVAKPAIAKREYGIFTGFQCERAQLFCCFRCVVNNCWWCCCGCLPARNEQRAFTHQRGAGMR